MIITIDFFKIPISCLKFLIDRYYNINKLLKIMEKLSENLLAKMQKDSSEVSNVWVSFLVKEFNFQGNLQKPKKSRLVNNRKYF